MINAYKHSELNNIEILVSNYEIAKIRRKFDVITLVGVFEYAALYIHTNKPYKDFLIDVYGKLKTNGRLYIAIENRLGVKYFSGCKEDHTGRSFEGIEGYVEEKNVKTFSYYEWIHLLEECGIDDYYFMYPYPDYKFSQVIYSDIFLPHKCSIFEPACDYGEKKRRLQFYENDFLNHLCPEEFKIFSNSFLICIRKGKRYNG